eukprot:scaffold7082_cov350-Prasinococcus_capsulatus_cf.AAC.2
MGLERPQELAVERVARQSPSVRRVHSEALLRRAQPHPLAAPLLHLHHRPLRSGRSAPRARMSAPAAVRSQQHPAGGGAARRGWGARGGPRVDGRPPRSAPRGPRPPAPPRSGSSPPAPAAPPSAPPPRTAPPVPTTPSSAHGQGAVAAGLRQHSRACRRGSLLLTGRSSSPRRSWVVSIHCVGSGPPAARGCAVAAGGCSRIQSPHRPTPRTRSPGSPDDAARSRRHVPR